MQSMVGAREVVVAGWKAVCRELLERNAGRGEGQEGTAGKPGGGLERKKQGKGEGEKNSKKYKAEVGFEMPGVEFGTCWTWQVWVPSSWELLPLSYGNVTSGQGVIADSGCTQ